MCLKVVEQINTFFPAVRKHAEGGATRVCCFRNSGTTGMKMALAAVDRPYDLRSAEGETTKFTAKAVVGEEVKQVNENRQEKNRRSVPPLAAVGQ